MDVGHLIPYFIAVFFYMGDFLFRLFRESEGRGLIRSLFGVGFAIHTVFLFLRWAVAGRAPFVGMFESISFYTWSVALVAIIMELRGYLRPGSREATFIAGYCSVFAVAGAISPKTLVPKIPVLDTRWFEVHVALSFISYGAVTASVPFAMFGDFLRREALVQRLTVYGFSLFSAGMIAGGIWAYYAWGSYWIWTPKEIFSAVLWVYLGAVIHSRMEELIGPGARKILYAFGYVIMMFTYLGVSLLLKSSHSFG